MFQSIAERVPKNDTLPERARRLDILQRVLEGTFYDVLPYPFHEEKTPAGEYIPIRDRQPSVRTNLCKVVVDDAVALLFGEGRFPAILCEQEAGEDKPTQDGLAAIAKDCNLGQIMLDAATRGSVGSVCIQLRILKGRVFPLVHDTTYLTPTWDPTEPDTLLSVKEHRIVSGQALADEGYSIADDMLGTDHVFWREWDVQEEIWFKPIPVRDFNEGKRPRRDEKLTVTHGMGFCPMVWVKNLPGGKDPDGACTFLAAIDTVIEIDYQLSQGGRGLKYSSDPTLLIKEPAGSDGTMIRGGGNAIVVDKDGDARMLEIGGTASAAVLDYVRCLREFALEAIHGNRSNADKISAAQSGKALEILHQPLVWLADRLRSSYGEYALLTLARMIVQASQQYPLKALGQPVKLNPSIPLTLRWRPFFDPTPHDRQMQATTLDQLRDGGFISRETAVGVIAPVYDIEDIPAELAKIKTDQAEDLQRLVAEKAAVQAKTDAEE